MILNLNATDFVYSCLHYGNTNISRCLYILLHYIQLNNKNKCSKVIKHINKHLVRIYMLKNQNKIMFISCRII